tara:strand:+ start:2576 stop:3427 length:852 start_codon:yes stop_codon:yes gene_type:complete
MKIIKNELSLVKKIIFERSKNYKIHFIPTMGSIHRGHRELIKSSQKKNTITIVSIFLNKLQFNDRKDYENYPSDLNSDLLLLKKLSVNYAFVPNPKKFINQDFSSFVRVKKYEGVLCDKFRGEHFQGVSTVITKFLIIIKPDYIYLGEKDFQQMLVIKKLIKDLHFGTKVFVKKTIREKDGLAYSSRNLMLSVNQRKIASHIYKSLKELKKICNEKRYDSSTIQSIKYRLKKIGLKVNYLEILKEHNLENIDSESCKYRAFISVNIKNINLIDNLSLGTIKFF